LLTCQIKTCAKEKAGSFSESAFINLLDPASFDGLAMTGFYPPKSRPVGDEGGLAHKPALSLPKGTTIGRTDLASVFGMGTGVSLFNRQYGSIDSKTEIADD